jgi:hypothetical protein
MIMKLGMEIMTFETTAHFELYKMADMSINGIDIGGRI